MEVESPVGAAYLRWLMEAWQQRMRRYHRREIIRGRYLGQAWLTGGDGRGLDPEALEIRGGTAEWD